MKFGIEALQTVQDLSRKLVTILKQIVTRIETLENAPAPSVTLPPIELSDIEQSGATTGQVATWDGAEWVPQTPIDYTPVRELDRMISNDIVSSTAANVPLLPWSLIATGTFISNQNYVHATAKARTIGVFRPSATANSGVRFSNSYGFSLAQGSYQKTIVKLFNLGSSALNNSIGFTTGFNSSAATAIGNAGVIIKVVNSQINIQYRRNAGGSTQSTANTSFTSFGVWLVFELEYTANDTVVCTVSDLDTGAVIFTDTVTGSNVPNYTTQGSGDSTFCMSECIRTTGGAVDFVAYDYVGFYAG